MKKALVLALALSCSTVAFATSLKTSGRFTSPTTFGMMAYDKAGCLNSGGTWSGEEDDGPCFMTSQNEVEIKADKGDLSLSITKVGTNEHMCQFEGKARTVPGGLFAAESVELYGENGEVLPGTCVVSVTFQDADTVSVHTNDKCADFCGANMDLDMDGLKRQ